MFTFISNVRRFQVISLLLAAVCVVGIAWICQSTAVAQPEDEYEYSYYTGDENVSEENSSHEQSPSMIEMIISWIITASSISLIGCIIGIIFIFFILPLTCNLDELIEICKKFGNFAFPYNIFDYFKGTAELNDIQNRIRSLDPESPEYKDYYNKSKWKVRLIYYKRLIEVLVFFCKHRLKWVFALLISLLPAIYYIIRIIKELNVSS